MVTAYLLAGAPTNLYPSLLNATTDGVVLIPSAFSITLAVPAGYIIIDLLPSMMETHELVVPKSIPMTYSPFNTLLPLKALTVC